MYHIPSIRSKDFVHRAVIIKNETFPIDPEKNCAPRGAIPSNGEDTCLVSLLHRLKIQINTYIYNKSYMQVFVICFSVKLKPLRQSVSMAPGARRS